MVITVDFFHSFYAVFFSLDGPHCRARCDRNAPWLLTVHFTGLHRNEAPLMHAPLFLLKQQQQKNNTQILEFKLCNCAEQSHDAEIFTGG